MQKSVNVIGAGIAGLAAAIRMAARGCHVTVFERSGQPGGKISSLTWKGYRWDAGPSLFVLPDLIEELYVLAGEEMKTSLRFQKLDLAARHFYEDGKILNAYVEPERFAEEAEKILGEPASRITSHLEKSRKIYDLTNDMFIFHNFMRFGTFVSQKFITALMQFRKLDSMTTMHEVNSRHFESKQLIQLFDLYAAYNGSDPFRAPGTLNVISHLEHNMGTFFPEQGMVALANALYQLADKLGVVFHFNEPVEKVVMDKGIVRGVVTGSGLYSSDLVISDIDVFYLYRDLLEDASFPVKQFRKERSSSAVIFYWAMDREFPQLDLHNIFLSSNYREEFRVLGRKQNIYEDPTVHLFISSKIVPGDAPKGKENWYVMINAPENLGQDWDHLVTMARGNILSKLYRMLGTKVEPMILHEMRADPQTIETATFSHRGALYGASSNSRIAAFRRHPNHLRKYRGLYFVGGSVHPGGGIPLCLASARIVDDLIGNHFLYLSKRKNS